jgi:hypothetical protein
MELRDLFTSAQSSVGNTYDRSVDRLLDRMGLQYKQSAQDVVLPALGIFAAGLAVGATLGLLFAPKPGAEVRQGVRRRLETYADDEQA